MKQRFLILLLSVFSLNVFAGPLDLIGDDDKPDKIILNVGMSNARFDVDEFKFKTDLLLGIQRDVKMWPFIWLNTGLFFNQIGSKIPSEPKFDLDYLQLPVGVKVKLGPVYVLGGASGAYSLAAKQGSIDISSEIKNIDFAVHAGVGVKLLFLSLEGRYNWGLTDIYQGNDPEKYDINNRYFQLMLGINIP